MNNAKHRLNTMSVHQLGKAALAAAALLACALSAVVAPAATVYWTSGGNNIWDTVTTNWSTASNNDTANTTFAQSDTAQFLRGANPLNMTLGENITVNGIWLSRSVTIEGGGNTLTLSGPLRPRSTDNVLRINAPITLGGNVNQIYDGANSSVHLAGNVSGSANITISSGGPLTLSGNNADFSGNLTSSGGTLLIGSNSATGTGALTVLLTDVSVGTLDPDFTLPNLLRFQPRGNTGRFFSTAGSTPLSVTGNVSLESNVGNLTNGGFAIRTSVNAPADFSGIISDSGTSNFLNLNKDGAGVLIFSGANTFKGTMTVQDGTLLINGNQSAATGLSTVFSGATLGGTGTIGGSATVDGSIAPGSGGIGTLSVGGNLTWNAGNAWLFELGSAAESLAAASSSTNNDLLALGGAFTQGSGSSFTFDFGDTGSDGWYRLVDYVSTTFATGENSSFAATGLPSGKTANFVVDADTTALYVQIVPEPAVLGLAACGVALLGLAALRRRRA